MKEKYRDSEMQSLRFKENRKGVSERRQEQPNATLYRKMLILVFGFWNSSLFVSNKR